MNLQVGDLCFCQTRGGKSWPGKVLKVVSRGFQVKLFCSGQFVRIGRGNVWKVDSDTLARFVNENTMKDSSFQLSVKIMLTEYGQLDKEEVNKNTIDQTFPEKEVFLECLGLSKVPSQQANIDEVAASVVIPAVCSKVINQEVTGANSISEDNFQSHAVENEFQVGKECEEFVVTQTEEEMNEEVDKNSDLQDLSAMIDDALDEIRKKMRMSTPIVNDSHLQKKALKPNVSKVNKSSNKSLQESRKITNKLFMEKIISLETGGYTCRQCNSGFGLRLAAKSHAVTCGAIKPKHVRKKKILECLECNAKLEGKINLNKHFALKHMSDPYLCSFCGKKYFRRKGYKTHLKSHTSGKTPSYSCDQCGYQARWKWLVNRHKKFYCSKVEKQLVFQCPFCDFKAGEKWCLDRHVEKLCKTKPSSASADSFEELIDSPEEPSLIDPKPVEEKNMLDRQGDNKSVYFSCDQCQYRTKQNFMLRRHKKFYCKKRDLKLNCNFCDFKTGEKWSLIRHENRCNKKTADAPRYRFKASELVDTTDPDVEHPKQVDMEFDPEEKSESDPDGSHSEPEDLPQLFVPQIYEWERIRNLIVSERQDMLRKLQNEMKEIDDEDCVQKKKRMRKKVPINEGMEPRRSARKKISILNPSFSNTEQLSNQLESSYEDEGTIDTLVVNEVDINVVLVDTNPSEVVEAIVSSLVENIIEEAMLEEAQLRYMCDSCGLNFRDNHNLKRHKARKHTVSVQCKRCKTIVESKWKYDLHQKNCFFQCKYVGCDKKFKERFKFDAHEREFTLLSWDTIFFFKYDNF